MSPRSQTQPTQDSRLSPHAPSARVRASPPAWWQRRTTAIAALSIAAIVTHVVLRFGVRAAPHIYQAPLILALAIGGLPLLYDLLRKVLRQEFGADLLGGISIITSIVLGEYLAGSIIVLMLAGGEALESYALSSASSVLAALARRMPAIAHRQGTAELMDVLAGRRSRSATRW